MPRFAYVTPTVRDSSTQTKMGAKKPSKSSRELRRAQQRRLKKELKQLTKVKH